MHKIASLFMFGCLLVVLGQANSADGETVGERFDKAIREIAKQCASRKLEPNEVCGEVAKLKPADPLATEEGRFAHSIKIPNTVPKDSGYKPGVTSAQYFEHLCKTEAGEFIYKTVENVDGVYQMRPRPAVTYEANHLYALEDPYGGPYGSNQPEIWFVGPTRYRVFESPDLIRRGPGGLKEFTHPSYLNAPPISSKIARYFGYDGRDQKTMQKEFDTVRKSRYGYTWRGISRPNDREMGVAGSELIILDLVTGEVLGVHRGYARFEIDEKMGQAGFQWSKRCPVGPNLGGGARLSSILKVLTPTTISQGK
ncbi:MAG: hypothetical protein ABIU05_11200 [Nitrospirales bacterium]